jgi:hypothetical protein
MGSSVATFTSNQQPYQQQYQQQEHEGQYQQQQQQYEDQYQQQYEDQYQQYEGQQKQYDQQSDQASRPIVSRPPAVSYSQALPGFMMSSFSSQSHYSTAHQAGGGGEVASIPAPAVNVAYLGPLSSELIQQIVRNLPLTSQLGEVRSAANPTAQANSPYHTSPAQAPEESTEAGVPGTGNAGLGWQRSISMDKPSPKSRIRTTSLHSVSSELSSEEHHVPPLMLGADVMSQKARSVDEREEESWGSKGVTPRSESDGHSCASGTSLGKQIKLMSERNTSSERVGLSLLQREGLQDMGGCSVVLHKLDLTGDPTLIISDEDLATICMNEESPDRQKKRKTKKNRDQLLHRRRAVLVDSSSEEEEEEEDVVKLEGVGDGVSTGFRGLVEKMEEDCELDSMLVGSDGPASDKMRELLTMSSDSELTPGRTTSIGVSVSPSR